LWESRFFYGRLESLSQLAEHENWNSKNSIVPDRLFNYVTKTFEFCHDNNLLLYNEDQDKLVFNTGLMTPLGEDIYGYFIKNEDPPSHIENPKKFKFISFLRASDRLVTNNFNEKPLLAKYTDNPIDYIFDVEKDMDFNATHIFQDHWDLEDGDYDRFTSELRALGKEVAKALINDAASTAIKRIKRNHRLVVPQYYNNQIMYLIPLIVNLPNDKITVLALAVEKTQTDTYRVNTIFDLDMAYTKARLVMKPESNWLIE
jgi:hypothetical protein